AALADHDRDGRHLEPAHTLDAGRDDPGLPLLLGGEARVGAGRANAAHHGQAELVRQPEHAHGLAVAARVAHAEVPRDVLLGVATLLLADDHHLAAVELGQTGDHRRVVAERAVAVELLEARERLRQVVEGRGAAGRARHLHALPAREVLERVALEALEPRLEEGDLLGEVDALLVGVPTHVLDLGLQVLDRLLKGQRHAASPAGRAPWPPTAPSARRRAAP